ncbi:hypothetical protein O6H91_Y203900 [Diphasiastrum complanatum]|nr:hypothetical protein O6H91_Y203900 [Diphasiastrum complanatum]
METATVALGPQAGQIIAILVAASTLGTLNAAVLSHGRYLYAAARSGYIFSWMGHISKESGAPYIALIASGAWCIFILTLLQSFHQILGYFGPVSLFFIGLTAAAHIKIRRDLPDLPRAYTVKFYPYIPIIVMLACLYLIVTSFITNLLPTFLAFGLAFLSLPCYKLSEYYYRCKSFTPKDFFHYMRF